MQLRFSLGKRKKLYEDGGGVAYLTKLAKNPGEGVRASIHQQDTYRYWFLAELLRLPLNEAEVQAFLFNHHKLVDPSSYDNEWCLSSMTPVNDNRMIIESI